MTNKSGNLQNRMVLLPVARRPRLVLQRDPRSDALLPNHGGSAADAGKQIATDLVLQQVKPAAAGSMARPRQLLDVQRLHGQQVGAGSWQNSRNQVGPFLLHGWHAIPATSWVNAGASLSSPNARLAR